MALAWATLVAPHGCSPTQAAPPNADDCNGLGCAPRYNLQSWQQETGNVRALALDTEALYLGGGNLSRMTN